MKWSNENVEKLKQLYFKKVPPREISLFLGISTNAIRNKAYNLGITNSPRFTEEEKNYVIENYKSYNLREIAATLGREKNYANVCRLARKLGVERTMRKSENPKNYKDEYGVSHKMGWERETAEERASRISTQFIEWHSKNDHPKGMAGKHHSKEYCNKISERATKYWQTITPEELEKRRIRSTMTKIKNGTLNPNDKRTTPYSTARGGKRNDLNNIYFRSSWEANIARYYNFVGIKWEFEPKTFIFPDIKKGCVSYTPDFYLPDENRWVEIKGWMNAKSKTKLRRFEKYFPEEFAKLEIISGKEYKEFAKYSRLIAEWED